MPTPDFRFNPHFPELAEHFATFSDADLVEMLNRRDVQLEDWLKNYGAGREYDTVVVAAFDSHRDGRNAANFLCTGTNDETTIQEAVDSCPSAGGQVVLLEGAYSGNGTVTGSENIGIRAMGVSTSLSGIRFATFGWVDGLFLTANSASALLTSVALVARCALTNEYVGGICLVPGAGTYGTGNQGTVIIGSNLTGDVAVSGRFPELTMLGCEVSFASYGVQDPAGLGASLGSRVVIEACKFRAQGSDPLAAISMSGASNSQFDIEIVGSNFAKSTTASVQPRSAIILTSVSTGRHVISGNGIGPTREHQIKLVGCSNGGLVTANQLAGLASSTTNTFDNIHLDAGTDKWTVIANQAGGDGGNQRNNVRINSSDCDTNHVVVGLNDFRNAVTADLTDSGTSTIKTMGGNQVGQSLVGTTAQADDAALFWMGNEAEPSAAPAIAALTVLTAMGGY